MRHVAQILASSNGRKACGMYLCSKSYTIILIQCPLKPMLWSYRLLQQLEISMLNPDFTLYPRVESRMYTEMEILKPIIWLSVDKHLDN